MEFTRFNDSPSPICFDVGEVRGGESLERSSSFPPKWKLARCSCDSFTEINQYIWLQEQII